MRWQRPKRLRTQDCCGQLLNKAGDLSKRDENSLRQAENRKTCLHVPDGQNEISITRRTIKHLTTHTTSRVPPERRVCSMTSSKARKGLSQNAYASHFSAQVKIISNFFSCSKGIV